LDFIGLSAVHATSPDLASAPAPKLSPPLGKSYRDMVLRHFDKRRGAARRPLKKKNAGCTMIPRLFPLRLN